MAEYPVKFFRGFLAEPDCTGCPLQGTRKIPPEGNLHAHIAFVGEGPGEEEEVQGLPFVGRSGQLLNALLKQCRIERAHVWISNAELCRPRPVRVAAEAKCPDCKPKRKKKVADTPTAAPCQRCNDAGRVVAEVAYGEKQVVAVAARHCRSRLLSELGYIQPRVVVPLGKFSLEAIIGKSSGILKHRGAVHTGAVPRLAQTVERLYAQATEATMLEGEPKL